MFYPIKLDKMRNLRYGMKALSLVEETLGMPAAKLNMENMTMKDAATIIWAGLVHEDKELTPDKVMDLIDDNSSIEEAVNSMSIALEGAFGGNEAKNPKRAASKGKNLA